MYPAADEEEAAPSGDGGQAEPAPKDEEAAGDDEGKMEGTTALLPKSILAGKEFKPGEEVVLKIVHIYGDEVEVAYATGEEGGGEYKDKPEMGKSMDKMSAMVPE